MKIVYRFNPKLTDEQVLEIKASPEKQAYLAMIFKVTPALICMIKKGKRRKKAR